MEDATVMHYAPPSASTKKSQQGDMEKSNKRSNLQDYESLGSTSAVNKSLMYDAEAIAQNDPADPLPPRTWGDVVLPWRWMWPVRQAPPDPAAVLSASRLQQEETTIGDEVDAWLDNLSVETVGMWQKNAKQMEEVLNTEARRLAAEVQSMKTDAKRRMQQKKHTNNRGVRFHRDEGDAEPDEEDEEKSPALERPKGKQCIDEARTIADTAQSRRNTESFATAACNINTLVHNTRSGFTDKHLELLNDLMFLQKCPLVADLATAILTSLEVDVGRLTVTQLQFARKSVAAKVWKAISTTASSSGLTRATDTASKDEVRRVLDEITPEDTDRLKSEFY